MPSDRRPRRARPSSPPGLPLGLNIAVLLVTAMLTAVGIGLALWLLLGAPAIQKPSPWSADQIFNFTKIVLSVVGGIGGVVALVIAYRRQRLGEASEHRENAKLFAENFTKATEQLGSDQAPVRLAGMYALEHLAQTPEQQQTIVNVLCAYLRMPYIPPTSQAADNEARADPATNGDTSPGPTSDSNDSEKPTSRHHKEGREQERQVRLTAQRILAEHLRPESPTGHNVNFWANIDLDLTGTTLLDIDFTSCHIRNARFDGAEFQGVAGFEEAEFQGDALFDGAQFQGVAGFEEAEFQGVAKFEEAEFQGVANFDGAQFQGVAKFDEAQFHDAARFGRTLSQIFAAAAIQSFAEFDGAQFQGVARFGWTLVKRLARSFQNVDGAQFQSVAGFKRAQFQRVAGFDGAQFQSVAEFDEAQFHDAARFDEAKFHLALGIDSARVRMDVKDVERTWPGGYGVVEPSTPEERRLPNRSGEWWYLRRIPAEEIPRSVSSTDIPPDQNVN